MKFDKIHMPDCTKAFEIAKTCGCVTGNCLGTAAAWVGAGIAVVGVFIACLVGLAAWGVIKALPVALLAVGHFTKDVISGTVGDSNVGRTTFSSGAFRGRELHHAAQYLERNPFDVIAASRSHSARHGQVGQ